MGSLGKKMVELTGDYTPDVRALQAADIVTTTPEKWDGIRYTHHSTPNTTTLSLPTFILFHIHSFHYFSFFSVEIGNREDM